MYFIQSNVAVKLLAVDAVLLSDSEQQLRGASDAFSSELVCPKKKKTNTRKTANDVMN